MEIILDNAARKLLPEYRNGVSMYLERHFSLEFSPNSNKSIAPNLRANVSIQLSCSGRYLVSNYFLECERFVS